jgi:hypothetical protein
VNGPIAVTEMAGILRQVVNAGFGQEIADPQHAGAFELTAPATGQRFRVIVNEVAGWSDRMDRELAEVTREVTP